MANIMIEKIIQVVDYALCVSNLNSICIVFAIKICKFIC